MAAATAAVPSRLWPQPCPGAGATSGALRASARRLGQPGQRVVLGEEPDRRRAGARGGHEGGRLATHAAGDLEPFLLERLHQRLADFFSFSAVSGMSQNFFASVVQRSRVWSR